MKRGHIDGGVGPERLGEGVVGGVGSVVVLVDVVSQGGFPEGWGEAGRV